MAYNEIDTNSIARVCHEANKAYCETIGDYSQSDWLTAPDWQRDSARDGVEFHLKVLEEGGQPDPADSHNNWYNQKRAEGWKHGPAKDPVKKEHPCFVPYNELPPEQKVKDYIFIGIVRAFHAASHSQS